MRSKAAPRFVPGEREKKHQMPKLATVAAVLVNRLADKNDFERRRAAWVCSLTEITLV